MNITMTHNATFKQKHQNPTQAGHKQPSAKKFKWLKAYFSLVQGIMRFK